MFNLSRRHLTLLIISIGAVSFAGIIARYAQAEGVPSLVASFYRLLFSTLMLAPFWLRRVRHETHQWSARDVGLMAGVGLILAAHFATWVTSLEYTSVASSTVLVTTESLWVPLGTVFLLKERVQPKFWWGVVVALLGLGLLVAGDAGETRFEGRALLGDGLALSGAFASSLYLLAGRHLRKRHSLLGYATVTYTWATVFLLAMCLIRGDPLLGYSAKGVAIMFAFALFPMILGHTVINYLLRWVPAHYFSTTVLAEPVVSAGLAILLFGEAVTTFVLAGGVAILIGIFLALRGERAATQATPVVNP